MLERIKNFFGGKESMVDGGTLKRVMGVETAIAPEIAT